MGVGGQYWPVLYPVLEIANNRDSQETVTALETIISHMRMSQSLQRQQNGYQDSNRKLIGRQTSQMMVGNKFWIFICLFERSIGVKFSK